MDPTLQNAMMLQAIKAGGQMQQDPQQQTTQAMGANPMGQAAAFGSMQQTPQMAPNMAPTDPASQAGSLGAQQPMPMPPGMMQQNPIAAALMSAIPGGGQ